VADSEKKTIQTPPEIACYWGTEGPPQLLRQPRPQTPAKRLIKARWEKEGQRRSVIIPAGNVATTTIGCNWLQNVNHREQEREQTITIWGCT
jgi:hypothetical protein